MLGQLGQGSPPSPRDYERSSQSADRRGRKERPEVAFALDQKDILEIDLVEHEQPKARLYAVATGRQDEKGGIENAEATGIYVCIHFQTICSFTPFIHSYTGSFIHSRHLS